MVAGRLTFKQSVKPAYKLPEDITTILTPKQIAYVRSVAAVKPRFNKLSDLTPKQLRRLVGRLGGEIIDTSSAVDPLAPAAPTLDLVAASDTGISSSDNVTNDTTPDIDFITAIAVVAGDVLKIFDNGVQVTSHIVTAGEAGLNTVPLGLSPLSEGSHSLTGTHTIAGPHTSPLSNALPIVVDTTAPVLSSTTGISTGTTTADISVSTNEGSGILYYVVDQNLSTPSTTQIKVGQDQGGGAADKSANTGVSSTGTKTFNITGLVPGTTYKAYFAQDDAASNTSDASASASFTTDVGVFSARDISIFSNLSAFIINENVSRQAQYNDVFVVEA